MNLDLYTLARKHRWDYQLLQQVALKLSTRYVVDAVQVLRGAWPTKLEDELVAAYQAQPEEVRTVARRRMAEVECRASMQPTPLLRPRPICRFDLDR